MSKLILSENYKLPRTVAPQVTEAK